ncbi:MAG: T6SS amidase immunity protein Tai4 family protein [Alcaligenaceae bacterium]|nr:T6SS amidase immunity protein Tai4 family protein [Alcaligenaceae bacterium]
MRLFNLTRASAGLAVTMASVLSLFSVTALAEDLTLATGSDHAALQERASPDGATTIAEGEGATEPILQEQETALAPPDFSELEKLRDFDHDLVDFSPASERSYKQSFKDEVLAFCISSAYYEFEAVKADALYTAAAFHSWGRYQLEDALDKVPTLVAEYLQRPYRDEPEEAEQPQMLPQLKLLKCLDLYHSAELESLAKEYVIDPDRSYAEDHSHIP